jgi:hypothetical protein
MKVAFIGEEFAEEGSEPARNRTENQQIKSLLLYQLSYGPTRGRTSITSRIDAAGAPHHDSCGWCARLDSNQRPLASEANALSN